MKNLEVVIKNIENKIEGSIMCGDDPNDASWGYETGILISQADAVGLLKAITDWKSVAEKLAERLQDSNLQIEHLETFEWCKKLGTTKSALLRNNSALNEYKKLKDEK